MSADFFESDSYQPQDVLVPTKEQVEASARFGNFFNRTMERHWPFVSGFGTSRSCLIMEYNDGSSELQIALEFSVRGANYGKKVTIISTGDTPISRIEYRLGDDGILRRIDYSRLDEAYGYLSEGVIPVSQITHQQDIISNSNKLRVVGRLQEELISQQTEEGTNNQPAELDETIELARLLFEARPV